MQDFVNFKNGQKAKKRNKGMFGTVRTEAYRWYYR